MYSAKIKLTEYLYFEGIPQINILYLHFIDILKHSENTQTSYTNPAVPSPIVSS